MKKIILGLALLLLFQNNLYANKQASFRPTWFDVDEWIVEVKNYYNQSAGIKTGKSNISLKEAENNALNACKEDKIFNANKPAGCLISTVTETYERSWRYDLGVMPIAPITRDWWSANSGGYEVKLDEQKRESQIATNLEKRYGSLCLKYQNGSDQYKNCLLEQEKIAKNIEEKKLFAQQEQQRKIFEADRSQKKIIEDKRKEEAIKIAKMLPDDRRAYNCTEKFGFRKGSDKFKDCLFELYKVESELEKLELQKKVAQANLEAAKVKEAAARSEQDRTTALLQRQTLAQEMSATAALQQARIADFESNQRLFDTGMEMLRGERRVDGSYRAPARAPMNCQYHAKMLSCF